MRLALCSLLVLSLQQKPAWDEVLAAGRKNLERLQTLRGMLPKADFDPAARADAIGGDVDGALEFVKTLAPEAYRGVMKGARGALISRRANAADRALLLAALLPGKEAKLVKGTLAPEKQPAPALPAYAPLDRNVEPIAAKFGTDPAKLKQKAEAQAARAKEFRAELKARVDRDRAALAGALEAAGFPVPPAAAPSDETWWLRLGDRDLLKPEGAEEHAVFDPAQVPAEEHHRLAIRMFIRRGDEEVPVLDVGFRAADLYGRTLRVANVASDNPGRLTKIRGPKPKEYLDAMAATGQFIPLLDGIERPITGHPFDLAGNRMTVKNGMIEKVQKVSGLFDDLPGGEPAKKQELDGCRLEVELSSPGAEPAVARRPIWDRKGGKLGRQRVFDLLQSREILVLPGELSAEAALDAALEVDLASRDAMLKQLAKPVRVVEIVPPRVNARLYQFALVRAAALRELGALSAPRPTLVSFVSRVLDAKGPALRAGFDVLSNPLAGPGAKSWKDSAAFAAGVVDTALEHELLKTRKSAHANASVLLEKAPKLAVEQADGVAKIRIPGGGWYEVDPRTGSCLGYMAEGGGQDMAEYAMLVIEKVKEVQEWQSHAELIESAMDCAMQAIDSLDAERAFATCIVGVGIGEAFGWAAGGIIGGAADAIGGPAAAIGGMAFEDWMTGAFGDAMDAATGGR